MDIVYTSAFVAVIGVVVAVCKPSRKTGPSEIICYPQKFRLKIYMIGHETPFSILQTGEERIKFARKFIKWASKKGDSTWSSLSGDSNELIIRRLSIAAITFKEEIK